MHVSCVWDAYQKYLIHDIEKIQRHAARSVMSDYSTYSSVTEMLKLLEWPTLETRRRLSRLSLAIPQNSTPFYTSNTAPNLLPDNTVSN